MKTKYIDITLIKKTKYSGFYILPSFIVNNYYKNLKLAWIIFIIEFQYNDNNSECSNCGEICRNIKEANEHCFFSF